MQSSSLGQLLVINQIKTFVEYASRTKEKTCFPLKISHLRFILVRGIHFKCQSVVLGILGSLSKSGLEIHFERARPSSFCKGHFQWNFLKSKGNFWRSTKLGQDQAQDLTKAKTKAKTRPLWSACYSFLTCRVIFSSRGLDLWSLSFQTETVFCFCISRT